MPGFNLVRNARVFFTTNLTTDSAKTVQITGATAGNTQEIQVMNGFSFSQNTENQAVTVSEAGLDPARGQRSFNTALAPVEFSFTTYVRPRNNAGVTCEEKVLWNALLSDVAIDASSATITLSTPFIARSANSNLVSITCASVDLSAFKVGEVVILKNIADTVAGKDWNSAVKIKSANAGAITALGASLTATTTQVSVEYLQAPAGVAVAPTTNTGTITMVKSGVTAQPALGNLTANLFVSSGRSNKNSLQAFGLVVSLDDQTYFIDNASMNQASVDFGLDGIAQIAWTGNGTALRQATTHVTSTVSGTFATGITGNFTATDTAAAFITNKLTTATLISSFRGLGSGAVTYNVAITGGNITINNNINYVTPEIMGVVNKPIGYFTGTRAISGNVTAYLKTGSSNTAGLLSTLLSAPSETKYYLGLQIGGSTNTTRVDVELPAVSLQVPSVETADVVSTTINFSAQPFDGSSSAAASLADGVSKYDLEATNDITLRYYAA